MASTVYGCAAVIKGHTDVVKLLLDGGADPNKTNRAGDSAISLAQRRGHTDIVKMLTDPRK